MNRIEIFNEVCTILLSYVLFLFTDFNSDYEQNQFECDMMFSAILGLNVLVHMVLLMSDSIRCIISKVRKMCCKRKILTGNNSGSLKTSTIKSKESENLQGQEDSRVAVVTKKSLGSFKSKKKVKALDVHNISAIQ